MSGLLFLNNSTTVLVTALGLPSVFIQNIGELKTSCKYINTDTIDELWTPQKPTGKYVRVCTEGNCLGAVIYGAQAGLGLGVSPKDFSICFQK